MWLEFGVARSPVTHEGIVSGGEVNRLIDGLCGERPPAIDLTHVVLARSKQLPEQHRGGICRRQHGLRLDPSFELLVQLLDRGRRGRSAGGRLGRPRCRAIHVDLWLARARPTRPRRRCPERTEPLAPRHVARQQTGPVCATGSTNDPKPEREQRTPPVSKKSSP